MQIFKVKEEEFDRSKLLRLYTDLMLSLHERRKLNIGSGWQIMCSKKIVSVKLTEYTLHLPFFFKPYFSNKYYIAIIMGKGDPKTRRGKIRRGSHGKSRPKLQKLKTLLKKLVGK